MIFFYEIDLAAGCITETVARRSGDLQTEKHHAALNTIANMQSGPQEPTSLTPLVKQISTIFFSLSSKLKMEVGASGLPISYKRL